MLNSQTSQSSQDAQDVLHLFFLKKRLKAKFKREKKVAFIEHLKMANIYWAFTSWQALY